MKSAMEKGTMEAALKLDMLISRLDSMVLPLVMDSLALIEGIYDIVVDIFPQRAKKLF